MPVLLGPQPQRRHRAGDQGQGDHRIHREAAQRGQEQDRQGVVRPAKGGLHGASGKQGSTHPLQFARSDGTTEAKYLLQFKGVWSDGYVIMQL